MTVNTGIMIPMFIGRCGRRLTGLISARRVGSQPKSPQRSRVYALHVAETTGCRVTGLDINVLGIRTANQLALDSGMGERVRFEVCDVAKPLPFADESFDAVFSNDVLCHVPGRSAVLTEIYRVLKTGVGRMLFSDALIIGGVVSQDEIAARS